MSHPAEAAHDPPGPVVGAQALPTPTGRPEELRSGARAVARVAARARATPTLRGELAPRLGAVWTGDAATAAVDEAAALAGRARAVVDALPAAAHALLAYAGTLEGVIARVRSVQRRWDAADEAHERAVAALTGGAAPVTGPLVEEHRRRLDDEHRAARAGLRRAHEEELDLLRSAGLRCASAIAAATDRTLPWPLDPTAARVRGAVTGGLPFADGVVAARHARESALGDAAALRRVLGGPPDAAASAALSARLRAHRGDTLHAQALLAELGADGLGAAVTELTAAGPATDVDAVREVLGLLGSLLVSAMQPLTARLPAAGQPVAGQPVTDPRTRDQLASGAALLADELVAGLGTVHTGAGGRSRAVGGWLLGQLLVGARASGDRRPLPARFVRRAAAAVAAAEVAETRDDDVGLRRGTTLRPDGSDVFASWFADAGRTGDALHVVLGEVTDEPGAAAALLAEPLPDVGGLGAALANSRGDRLTVGEHLVRRWVVVEAGGTETHHGLQLATDDDLDRLLTGLAASSAAPATAAAATGGVGPGLAAAVRARLVLEVSRTSAHAVREASSTALYAAGTATLEPTVVTWLAAMRANVDRALAAPPGTIDHGAYVAPTANGPQPLLDADELAGVVAALAVETGTGLHAQDPASAYDLLLDGELAATRRSLSQGGSPAADLVRLGFLDRAAAAALVDVARAQDELDRAAWQGLAEAKGVALALRVDPVAGLRTVIGTYATGGTMRTAADDLAVAVVRSDVELDQTLRDDGRRLALVGRVLALPGIGPVASVTAALDRGAARAPALPTAPQLRAAREAEIRAAWDALRDEGSLRRVEDAARRGAARDPGRLGVAAGRDGRLPELDRLPRGRSSTTKLVESEAQLRTLLRDLTRGAKRVDAGHYPGLRFLRPDGVEVRFREASTSGGATIDLRFVDGTKRKVHVR